MTEIGEKGDDDWMNVSVSTCKEVDENVHFHNLL